MRTVATGHMVRLGSVEIPFTMTLRRRSDLSITVRPNLAVEVVAPTGKSLQQIEAKIQERAPWILRQQLRYRDLHPIPEPKRFVSGETHRYLGRQYRLRVVQGARNGVALNRPYLKVEVMGKPTKAVVERIVRAWYSERARQILPGQLERCLKAHPSLRGADPPVRICRMSQRWGSCTANGIITLNPLLIQAPLGCIEYVILHELCHRTVMNHGPRFERLLTRVLPDWRLRRERLNKLD